MAKKQQNKNTQKPKQKNACACTKTFKFSFGRLRSSKKMGSYPTITKSQRHQKSGNKSIITLYDKNKKDNWRSKEINKNTEILKSRKPEKTNPLLYQFGTGDACAGGPCRDLDLYKLQILKGNSNDKNDKTFAKFLKHKHNKEYSQTQKYNKENAENNIKSLKEKNYCKCIAKYKEDKNPNEISGKENDNVGQVQEDTKLKHVCKCRNKNEKITSLEFLSDIKNIDNLKKNIKDKVNMFRKSTKQNICQCSMKSPTHGTVIKAAEMGKKSVKHKTLCECYINDKIETPRIISKKVPINKKKMRKQIHVSYSDHVLENNTLRPVNAGDQTGEPFFEMKVDRHDMKIINEEEINKMRTSRILQPRRSCICPSHRGVCNKGICEKAMKDKQTLFNCKCRIKNNTIECTDTSCRKHGKFKKKSIENNPLFEVKLDPVNMQIVNTAEVIDIFDKSNHGICPTGVCNKRGYIKCRCITNKLQPKISECTEKSCTKGEKCYLSYICSRVLSSTGNCKLSNLCSRIFTRSDNAKVNPVIYTKNGLDINFSSNRNHKERDAVPKKTINILEKNKKLEKVVKNGRKKKNKRKNVPIAPQLTRSQHSPYIKFIIKCLQRKRKRCKKRMKEEEKALEIAERAAVKEQGKILSQQRKSLEHDDQQWNCLTKFISGLLNLIVSTIKSILIGVWSIIMNPIRALAYIKRQVSDPPGTITKICRWFQISWGDRTSSVSERIKNINALNVIADTFEDTSIYNALAYRGNTTKERALFENRKKLRRRRMEQRKNAARFDCRHIFLLTMRHTPWMCCYHVCPEIYPQCLSLRNFMRNFFSVIVYLSAFLCWTPCIISFEVCRAFLCCFLCTN